ncbi:MAG: hypothetical protein GY869_10360 [Planctomycetes bacterium]|nr:hypothetical protein [Planctomycetota bacterium]
MKKRRQKKPPQNKTKKTPIIPPRFKPLFHVICALTVVAMANIFYWSPGESLIQRDPAIDLSQIKKINSYQSEIILVGNSILDEAVNELYLSNLLQAQTQKFTWGGSATATWYLFLKNIIIPAQHKPKTVAFFFRDHFLTDPTFRTTGEYKETVDEFAGPHEPLLDRLAYLDNMNPLFYHLYRYWPLYQH